MRDHSAQSGSCAEYCYSGIYLPRNYGEFRLDPIDRQDGYCRPCYHQRQLAVDFFEC